MFLQATVESGEDKEEKHHQELVEKQENLQELTRTVSNLGSKLTALEDSNDTMSKKLIAANEELSSKQQDIVKEKDQTLKLQQSVKELENSNFKLNNEVISWRVTCVYITTTGLHFELRHSLI